MGIKKFKIKLEFHNFFVQFLILNRMTQNLKDVENLLIKMMLIFLDETFQSKAPNGYDLTRTIWALSSSQILKTPNAIKLNTIAGHPNNEMMITRN